MPYTLLYRFSHNDQWTEYEFTSLKDFKTEILYKVLQGAEVKISDNTIALKLNDD